MPQSDRSGEQATGWRGAVALFPLGLVFAGITFLAIGAGRTTNTPAPAATTQMTASQASSESAADEAAAAAVIAISLARVAPQLPESALEPPAPQAKPAQTEAPRKPAPQRESTGKPASQPSHRAAATPAQQPAKPPESAPPAAVETKPAEEGFFARIGSYAPSPKKIAGAVSDGVSKIASYIPGL